jgi:hypothetical protein
MRTITLAIDDDTFVLGESYARENGLSLDALVSSLIRRQVAGFDKQAWLDSTFSIMDAAGGCSSGKRWTREELHERQAVS